MFKIVIGFEKLYKFGYVYYKHWQSATKAIDALNDTKQGDKKVYVNYNVDVNSKINIPSTTTMSTSNLLCDKLVISEV